ncbi:type II toxin-antitoxin system PemK/MazF family toxin [Chloroflexota bacterium]
MAIIYINISDLSSTRTRIRRISSEVPLGTDDGMPQDCVANLDTITTIPKDCLQSRITELNAKKLRGVEAAIRFALGLEQ